MNKGKLLFEEGFLNCSNSMAKPLAEFFFCSESVLFSFISRPEELLEKSREQTVSDYGLYNHIFMMSFSTMLSLSSNFVFFSCHVL
jgi:hypothetical protein